MSIPLILGSFLTKINKISKHKMNTQAEIGSSWRAPPCKGKYQVVMSPFVTQDSWLFNNASTQETNFLPKPGFFKTTRMNL